MAWTLNQIALYNFLKWCLYHPFKYLVISYEYFISLKPLFHFVEIFGVGVIDYGADVATQITAADLRLFGNAGGS